MHAADIPNELTQRKSARRKRNAVTVNSDDHLFGDMMDEALDKIAEETVPTSTPVTDDSLPLLSKIPRNLDNGKLSKRKASSNPKIDEEMPERKRNKPNTLICPSASSSSHLASHGRSWTEEEKELFISGVKLYGRGKWVQIADYIKTRNALQVKNHARNVFNRGELENLESIHSTEEELTASILSDSFNPLSSEQTSTENPKEEKAKIIVCIPNITRKKLYPDKVEEKQEENIEDNHSDGSDTEEDEDLPIRLEVHKEKQIGSLPPIPEEILDTSHKNIQQVIEERERLMESMPLPSVEYMMDETQEITDHERAFNMEFFMNNSTKTPERYIRIRNFCISAWRAQKPKYLTKTTIRLGLPDCGDVNAIGRIHQYLERLGVINFGVKKRKYSRRRSEKTTKQNSRTRKKNTEQIQKPIEEPAKPIPEIITEPEKSESKKKASNSKKVSPKKSSVKRNTSQRKAKNSSSAPVKNNSIEKIETRKSTRNVNSKKKPPAPKKEEVEPVMINGEPAEIVECLRYGDGTAAPFNLNISGSATIIMDMHSRMIVEAVTGLLGGYYDSENNCLHIELAVPCRSSAETIHCETDLTSESKAEKEIRENHKLSVVGWYHSHPGITDNPTIQDVEKLSNYQIYYEDEKTNKKPFVGVIVSPFSPLGPFGPSIFNFYHIETLSDKSEVPYYFPDCTTLKIAPENEFTFLYSVQSLLDDFASHPERINLTAGVKSESGLALLLKSITHHEASARLQALISALVSHTFDYLNK